jgi:hypothetical protein
VLAAACVATLAWWRTRPVVHALVTGVLFAALVLIKPHGVAVVLAGVLVAVLDAWAAKDWRRLALRGLVAAPIFFGVGNLIQIGSDSPPAHPLTFFMSPFYSSALGVKPAEAMGFLELLATASGAAILMGFPIMVGALDLRRRWRVRERRFVADEWDVTFLLLVLSLVATLAMVAVFASHAAVAESEARRLWGRYFEFFTPLVWLVVSPKLLAVPSRRAAIACAALPLAGLVGLMISFRCGVVLFPWDSTILTAFFAPDPVRAPMGWRLPYRVLATAAVVLAAAGFAWRRRPAEVGLALVLALGVLSTWQDHAWLGPLIRQRNALEADIRAIQTLGARPANVTLLARDANEGELVFLRFQARPAVVFGPPDQAPLAAVAGADELLVSGPSAPVGGPWRRLYRGEELSLFGRPGRLAGSPPL